MLMPSEMFQAVKPLISNWKQADLNIGRQTGILTTAIAVMFP
jgi:hypothetical protein